MDARRLIGLCKSLATGTLAVCLLVSCMNKAWADVEGIEAVPGDWTLEATIAEIGSWSTNPLMATEGAKALYGSTTAPQMIIRKTTPTLQASLDTKIEENIFNQSDFNSTDVHAKAGLAKSNQRWSASLQSLIDYDTTRTSELTTYGLTPVLSRHLGLNFTPQISFSPSAVDTYALSGSVAISEYGKTAFTDYETFSVSPSYKHYVDPRNAGIFALQAQQFQTTRNDAVRVNSFGSTIGWQTVFTPRFTADAAVGAQTSRHFNDGHPVDTWRLEYIFSGNVSFKGIQDTVTFSTARSQFPYGNGTEALQTSFALKERHNLNPLISLDFGAKYLTADYQIQSAGNVKEFAGGNMGLAYHATETIDVTASYQYRYETLTFRTKSVEDHSALLSLVYRPKMWTLGN